MAVVRSTEDIPAMTEHNLGLACSLCELEMSNPSECALTKCKHTFHRECITKWINSSNECPNCGKLCHENDLSQIGAKPIEKAKSSFYRGRGRGSATKAYNTRSSNRVQKDGKSTQVNVEGASLGTEIIDVDSQPEVNVTMNESQNPNYSQHNTTNQSNRGRRGNRNANRMAQMIETTVQRMLSQMNLSPWHQSSQEPTQQQQNQQQLQLQTQRQSTSSPPIHQDNLEWNSPNISAQNLSSVYTANRIKLHPDKVTTIIQSWNVKFDGSADGLHCEEFLYRIKCLVEETFNGNFNESVGKNLHVLMSGKARTWYWRYRKTVPRIIWESFCTELMKQYRDHRTTFDIREELHNRKQKPFESFETFYDAINSIIDRLAIPLEEEELIEIVIRNLRPEIRHELLYVQVRSIGHLKQLCQKREKLLNEDSFRRNNVNRYPTTGQQRRIAAIESEEINEQLTDQEIARNSDLEVNALDSQPKRKIICWNCDEEGHLWDMCLKDRKIFCYGCGLKDMYKPQCEKCSKNSKNYRNYNNNRIDPK